ncbi:MAG: NAD(P)/FAD-dependent oxidoreductase [Methylobacterium sp.]|uniref:flavin-containing monooxygenase n=1 Tax=Methylobacterium sp. TaxID=409 RepID=UPI0025F19C5E|nr:NAD(P)/FAD-dependent oxidoreductase [Methylobacterium sp.]MBX9930589.1 NAD(P)/FAD-dependent oxidoreductase [Methylobacterium sp.]
MKPLADPAVTVAIVGAGFGGLCLAMKLKAAGIHDFVVIDKNPEVGGTWFENAYPGAACDIDSYLYSYSFLPTPAWTRKFAGQAEIQRYLAACARDQGLLSHVRFGTEIVSAVFDATAGRWRLSTGEGEIIEARILAPACGQLNRPSMPAIPGLERFAGPCFHSARWDAAFDPSGKTVAVIGTGASAVQIVPSIVPAVERLILFQRSGAWVLPKGDRPFTRLERRLLSAVPSLARLYRTAIGAKNEMRGVAFVRFPWMLAPMAWRVRRRIRRGVRSPEKRSALVPTYRLGCKRVLISDDWYPALDQDKVEIVTQAITAVVADGVVTAEGFLHKADALVLATGFAAANPLAALHIVGPDGRALNEAWGKGAFAYLGMSVPGFPNLFILYGPNTNLSHDSIVKMLEAQADYVVEGIKLLEEHRLRTLSVKPAAATAFDQWLRVHLKETVWNVSCPSWYKTTDGRITNNWPGLVSRFRAMTRRFKRDDYDFQS